PAMSMEKKMDLQNQVIDAFPNVSIIDVTKLVERLSELLNQMSVTLQILALVTLIVGAFILFTVATFMAEERKADVAIMKAIGVKFRRIQSLFIFEFSILVFLASLFGILISIVMAGFIGRELFDGSIKATWTEWAILMIGGLS